MVKKVSNIYNFTKRIKKVVSSLCFSNDDLIKLNKTIKENNC